MTGVQTCALPISAGGPESSGGGGWWWGLTCLFFNSQVDPQKGPLTESRAGERFIRGEEENRAARFSFPCLAVLIPYRDWGKKMLLIPKHKQ